MLDIGSDSKRWRIRTIIFHINFRWKVVSSAKLAFHIEMCIIISFRKASNLSCHSKSISLAPSKKHKHTSLNQIKKLCASNISNRAQNGFYPAHFPYVFHFVSQLHFWILIHCVMSEYKCCDGKTAFHTGNYSFGKATQWQKNWNISGNLFGLV